jgi:hypothetical protein
VGVVWIFSGMTQLDSLDQLQVKMPPVLNKVKVTIFRINPMSCTPLCPILLFYSVYYIRQFHSLTGPVLVLNWLLVRWTGIS